LHLWLFIDIPLRFKPTTSVFLIPKPKPNTCSFQVMPQCPGAFEADEPHDHPSETRLNIVSYLHGMPRDQDFPSADLRAPSISQKRFQNAKTSGPKRKSTLPLGLWTAPKGGKRARLDNEKSLKMELHQSTCLNLNLAAGDQDTESDLWILPDFEEWEIDAETSQQSPIPHEREWAPLLERAVNSNRERLRRRLEGDGWDFVGGKYGEDSKVSLQRKCICATLHFVN
jgi:hypothetical protein